MTIEQCNLKRKFSILLSLPLIHKLNVYFQIENDDYSLDSGQSIET